MTKAYLSGVQQKQVFAGRAFHCHTRKRGMGAGQGCTRVYLKNKMKLLDVDVSPPAFSYSSFPLCLLMWSKVSVKL